MSIVPKGVPAPPFEGTHPLIQLAPLPRFLKSVSPPLFSVPPDFKVFQTIPPTLTQPPPALIRHTNLPYTNLNKYQKGDFTSSTVAFYQKSIFDFLNPFTDILGYLNL